MCLSSLAHSRPLLLAAALVEAPFVCLLSFTVVRAHLLLGPGPAAGPAASTSGDEEKGGRSL